MYRVLRALRDVAEDEEEEFGGEVRVTGPFGREVSVGGKHRAAQARLTLLRALREIAPLEDRGRIWMMTACERGSRGGT